MPFSQSNRHVPRKVLLTSCFIAAGVADSKVSRSWVTHLLLFLHSHGGTSAADLPTSLSAPPVRRSLPLQHRITRHIFPVPPAPALHDEFLIDIPIGQQPAVDQWGQTRHLVWSCGVDFPIALPFLPINLLIGASFSAS
jgi:hypothetical protein